MASTHLPIDSPKRRRLPILLRRAWYGLNQAFRRRIAHTGVTPDQFTVLRTLLEHGGDGITQSELTRLMASDPNTIASLIVRMEKAGMLERKTHEKDRRANRIRVKPLGKRMFEKVRSIAVATQQEVISSLPEDEREEFLAQLAVIAEACQLAAERSPKNGKAKGAIS